MSLKMPLEYTGTYITPLDTLHDALEGRLPLFFDIILEVLKGIYLDTMPSVCIKPDLVDVFSVLHGIPMLSRRSMSSLSMNMSSFSVAPLDISRQSMGAI